MRAVTAYALGIRNRSKNKSISKSDTMLIFRDFMRMIESRLDKKFTAYHGWVRMPHPRILNQDGLVAIYEFDMKNYSSSVDEINKTKASVMTEIEDVCKRFTNKVNKERGDGTAKVWLNKEKTMREYDNLDVLYRFFIEFELDVEE